MVTIPQVTIDNLDIDDGDYTLRNHIKTRYRKTIHKLDIEDGDYTSRNHR